MKAIQSYLEYAENVLRASKNTLSAYATDLRLFSEFTGKELEQVTRQDVEKFMGKSSKTCAAATVNRRLAAIRAMCGWGIRENLIAIDPSAAIKNQKQPRRIAQHLTKEEKQMLLTELETASERDKIILYLGLACGLRCAEIHDVEAENFNLAESILTVIGKGDKQRMIPLPEKAVAIFSSFVDGKSGRLFDINRKQIYNIVRKYMQRVVGDNRAHPHVLRHTYATGLYQCGEELIDIMNLLGHESISTTQIYIHTANDHLRKVVARSVKL